MQKGFHPLLVFVLQSALLHGSMHNQNIIQTQDVSKQMSVTQVHALILKKQSQFNVLSNLIPIYVLAIEHEYLTKIPLQYKSDVLQWFQVIHNEVKDTPPMVQCAVWWSIWQNTNLNEIRRYIDLVYNKETKQVELYFNKAWAEKSDIQIIKNDYCKIAESTMSADIDFSNHQLLLEKQTTENSITLISDQPSTNNHISYAVHLVGLQQDNLLFIIGDNNQFAKARLNPKTVKQVRKKREAVIAAFFFLIANAIMCIYFSINYFLYYDCPRKPFNCF
ncbi:hypothetical protein EKK58_06265 [Candidatus Dependentiae bacterium]|nr:MAG: hypothetical protein EKK58_06265 [Candidatus Dependentiae bacterium]